MTALEENDVEVAFVAVDGLRENRWVAEREHGNVVNSSSVGDVAAIESISPEEYEGKIGQFAADIDLYRGLDETLRTHANGVKWLTGAKQELYEEPRHVARSRDAAEDARNYLRTTRNNSLS